MTLREYELLKIRSKVEFFLNKDSEKIGISIKDDGKENIYGKGYCTIRRNN